MFIIREIKDKINAVRLNSVESGRMKCSFNLVSSFAFNEKPANAIVIRKTITIVVTVRGAPIKIII